MVDRRKVGFQVFVVAMTSVFLFDVFREFGPWVAANLVVVMGLCVMLNTLIMISARKSISMNKVFLYGSFLSVIVSTSCLIGVIPELHLILMAFVVHSVSVALNCVFVDFRGSLFNHQIA
ncbi:hypothetical protein ACFL08_00095 [Patescibacteria group bacterium]